MKAIPSWGASVLVTCSISGAEAVLSLRCHDAQKETLSAICPIRASRADVTWPKLPPMSPLGFMNCT